MDINGIPVAECKYDYASDFNQGFAVVSHKNKYGLIDINGNKLIEFEYDYISNGNQKNKWGYVAKKNNKIGIINTNGIQIIHCIYDTLITISDNIALVTIDDKKGYINKDEIQFWED